VVLKISRDDGFTLTELMAGSAITLVVLSGAMTAFKNAMSVNDAGTQIADSSQNLRTGANLLVRDLMQAGRKIPTGGIPIPSGAGATPINRPSPPGGPVYTFDNVNQTTLTAIVSGYSLGPTVDNSTTDIITFMMIDPLLGDLKVCDATTPVIPANNATIQNNAAYMTVAGTTTTNNFNWLVGDPANGISPVKAGDLIWFNTGGTALQTVTSTDATKIYFANNDWFNFNQTAAAAGTLLQLRSAGKFPCGFTAARIVMYTYYVDATTTPGTPRLTRVLNHYSPQALAGVVEDLDITYDLVDGVNNPTQVTSLPYTVNGLTYTATQVRTVNLHMGVRSDTLSNQRHDYVRTHVSTAISLRNLAFVARYQ
jgi:prepilin-type N-terminal cleavage/methylation domain-containing protein